MLHMRLGAACVLLVVVGGGAHAPGRLRAQASVQQLYLTVLDGDHRPVADLRPEDVVIEENGVRCEVLDLSRPGGYADVSVLVDTSEAVVPATSHVREGLTRFVRVLNGFARMSITTFGDLPVQVVRPTTRQEWLRAAIGRIFPSLGATPSLQDALMQAAVDIRTRGPARPSLLVVTSDQLASVFADTSPNVASRPAEQFVETLRQLGAPIHTVVLRSNASFEIMRRGLNEPGITPHNNVHNAMIRHRTQEWMTALETVSSRTGGRHVNVHASAGFERSLLQVANEIIAQYVLTYASPSYDVPPDQIDVRVGVARDDVTVRLTPVF